MLLSVVTPASRGVKELRHLLRDFKNQTLPKNLYEHIIVYDGTPSPDAVKMVQEEKSPNTVFCTIKKDMGNMTRSPGTNPRNHGIKMAKGEYIFFADDDDRYRDDLLEALVNMAQDGFVGVVQMTCQESRMYRDGSPDRWVLVPEIGEPFPRICHLGTPTFVIPTKWARESPWQHEPEHDFRFIKRICDRYHPNIKFTGGMRVDVDGQVIKNMKDWVTVPPLFRP